MVLDPEYAALPGRQASRIHVEDPFLPRNLNCVLWPENEDRRLDRHRRRVCGGNDVRMSGNKEVETHGFNSAVH